MRRAPRTAAHGADRRSYDWRDDGHRHRSQSVHVRPSYKALEGLPIAEQRKAAAQSRAATENPCREASHARLRSSPSFASSSPAAGDQSSSRWATRRITTGFGQERCGDRDAHGCTPDEVAYDYIIEENQYCTSGGELRSRVTTSRSAKCSTTRPACSAERRRRALHLDRGIQVCPVSCWRIGGRDRRRGPLLPLEHLIKRPNQRNRRLLRSVGSWSADAGPARRREHHRFRPSAACTSRSSCTAMPARRPAFRATGRWI